MMESGAPDTSTASAFSRRSLLKAGLAIGGAAVLAGCSSTSTPSSSTTTSTTTAGGSPKRGGTLTVGMSTGGPSDTLDPNAAVSTVDAARANSLCNRLTTLSEDGTTQLVLAESLEPNSDATLWTIRLRKGVVWHDGSPFTADDVIYTLKRIGAPKSTLGGVSTVSLMDLNGMKKIDDTTLQIPLTVPVADLGPSFSIFYMAIIKDGTTSFASPIGTGAFKFQSWKAGESSTFTRNDNYWLHPLPYVDQLVMNSITDDTARLNALLGGQVNAIELLNFSQAKAMKSSGQIQLLSPPAVNIVPMTMAVDTPPFNDVNVRQAFRLIANRPELVKIAQDGFGTVGNDLFGKGYPLYDSSLPQREQDLGQARSLLKKAGADKLTVTLNTSSVAPGMLESATAFAAQAQQAGVTVQLKNIPAGDYYGSGYLKYGFGQSQWNADTIPQWMEQAVVKGAPYNETHWTDPQFDALFVKARGELDAAKRGQMYDELQSTLWNSGGYLIWGFVPFIDGLALNVRGAVPNPAQDLSNYDFSTYWLA
jgi:peptide/nickel transport system substrate-binding protein